jgi:hypothetical protein
MVVDCSELNLIIIDEVFDALSVSEIVGITDSKNKYYSPITFTQRYHDLPLDKGDIDKTVSSYIRPTCKLK